MPLEPAEAEPLVEEFTTGSAGEESREDAGDWRVIGEAAGGAFGLVRTVGREGCGADISRCLL